MDPYPYQDDIDGWKVELDLDTLESWEFCLESIADQGNQGILFQQTWALHHINPGLTIDEKCEPQ